MIQILSGLQSRENPPLISKAFKSILIILLVKQNMLRLEIVWGKNNYYYDILTVTLSVVVYPNILQHAREPLISSRVISRFFCLLFTYSNAALPELGLCTSVKHSLSYSG